MSIGIKIDAGVFGQIEQRGSLRLRVQFDVLYLPQKKSLIQSAGLAGVLAASPYLRLTTITLFSYSQYYTSVIERDLR